jgi:hypothetical protein
VLFGLLLALGFVAGELPNSLIKRRCDIARGGRQGSPCGIVVFAVVVLGHSIINVLGYAIGARRT